MANDRSPETLGMLQAARRSLGAFVDVPASVRDELAQEAALRTLCALDVRHPAAYTAKVARRLAIDWLRRPAELATATPEQAEEPAWSTGVEDALDFARVRSLMADAPRAHRETLVLLFLDGRTIDEAVDLRLEGRPGVDRGRERDRWYKRRQRALTWMRRAVGPRSAPAA